jgi:myo-inositol-1(or 4)-monophosphatase
MDPQAIDAIDTAAVGEVLREAARRCIMPRFDGAQWHNKPDGSVVTDADVASQNFIRESLGRLYPGVALLGEEMDRGDQEAVLSTNGRVPLWCLDPLDGTSNFAAGVPMFGISLTYLAGWRSQYAWVYDPVRNELFTAVCGKGAQVNGKPLGLRRAPSLAESVGVVDFKRLPRQLAVRLVTQMPFHSQRNFGSSAIEWSWLAAGRFHFYLHGGQQIWDMAAGSLILAEAGGVAGNFAGAPLAEFRRLEKQSVVAALDAGLEREWRRRRRIELRF